MAPDRPELVEYEFGPAALDWIRYALDQGIAMGSPLCAALLSRFEATQPRVTTFLPPGLDEASLSKFDHGGKLPPAGEPIRFSGGRLATGEPIPFPGSGVIVRVSSTEALVESVVRDFLEGSPRNLLLAEFAFAEPTDPWIQTADSPVATAGDRVFAFAHSDSTAEAIETAVRETYNIYPPGVGVLTTLGDDLAPIHGTTDLGSRAVEELASRASLILIGAYDGEGVLFWHPPLSPAP